MKSCQNWSRSLHSTNTWHTDKLLMTWNAELISWTYLHILLTLNASRILQLVYLASEAGSLGYTSLGRRICIVPSPTFNTNVWLQKRCTKLFFRGFTFGIWASLLVDIWAVFSTFRLFFLLHIWSSFGPFLAHFSIHFWSNLCPILALFRCNFSPISSL